VTFFFVKSFPKKVTFWPRRYKTFLNGKKCDDSVGRETCFSLPVSGRFHLRWGWVFLERTQILSGIQFTTRFIDFFVVETKRFVGSFVNVFRQTCGRGKPAASARAELRKANAERLETIFPSEFAIFS